MKQIAKLNRIDKIYKPYNSERILSSGGRDCFRHEQEPDVAVRRGHRGLTHRVGIANNKDYVSLSNFTIFSFFTIWAILKPPKTTHLAPESIAQNLSNSGL